STPNESFQTEHLGKVLIRSDTLAEYVAHYLALPVEEARKWDRLVEGLRPEQELRRAIQAFVVKEPQSDLSTLKRLLLDAVGVR
ncbi:MAG TPA: hypothetical protein VND64_25010, partial [Pirellulales bacterium]|nr:hypothetical protein [Pirellulales bacterium]